MCIQFIVSAVKSILRIKGLATKQLPQDYNCKDCPVSPSAKS